MLLEVDNLTKTFRRGLLQGQKEFHALKGVSFALERGEIFGIIGESGCGKTTLLRCILHLIKPSGGRVLFDGQDLGALTPQRLRSVRHRMQMVFQDPHASLDPRMHLGTSVALALRAVNTARSEEHDRIAGLFRRVGLEPSLMRRYPHQVSGGQKQRVVLARALATSPDFLVLDEPVSSLDVSVQAQIIDLVLELQAEERMSYLFVSHDIDLVASISGRVAVMQEGVIVEQGSTADLMNSPQHAYTQSLLERRLGMA